MFKSSPLAARALCFVVLPALCVATGGLLYLRQSLPVMDGSPRTAPVGKRVIIERDEHGVVSISAKNDADAFFALGYAHAQDRLWQLELQRRTASGRLSEIFGRSSLQQDAWMRTVGVYEAAKRAWPHLSPEAQHSLTAYAHGVNAWLKSARRLPPEFIAIGVQPQPWTEIDSLAWAKVFALSLSRNFRAEISNFVLTQQLSAEQLRDLGAPSAATAASLAPQGHSADATGRALLALQQELQDTLKLGGAQAGSNAWAISAKCTQNGAAILANDAHLELQIPSLWYVAHLKGDRIDAAGMTLVGLPVIIFGHNHSIAWGGTNMLADVQDLYFEQTNPQRPTQYKDKESWRDFESRTETIRMRADFPASLRAEPAPVRIQVRSTVRGPIISDVAGTVDQVISLRWTALDPDDRSYEALYRLNYASDWSSFKEALRSYVAPAMNMIYADALGNIGFFGAGRIPIRRGSRGREPGSGWMGDTWQGYIPFEGLPQKYNPEPCYLASANQMNVDASYPYFISAEWAPPFRAQRIEQLLDEQIHETGIVSVEYVKRMQADTIDLGATRLAQFLARLDLTGAQRRRALQYLSGWHGSMERNSQAAAIFHVWTRNLRKELFVSTAPGLWNKPQQNADLNGIFADVSNDRVLAALTESRAWCDPAATAGERSCRRILESSLDAAIRELSRLRGPNMEDWKWGEVHATLYSHNPFSRSEALAPLFERYISNGGSTDTINAAHSHFEETYGYRQSMGAAFRQIMVMGQQPAHYYINSTGQSGNLLSGHYDDMVRSFRDVQYFELGEAAPASTLTLSPE